jgi:hypothetical protein
MPALPADEAVVSARRYPCRREHRRWRGCARVRRSPGAPKKRGHRGRTRIQRAVALDSSHAQLRRTKPDRVIETFLIRPSCGKRHYRQEPTDPEVRKAVGGPRDRADYGSAEGCVAGDVVHPPTVSPRHRQGNRASVGSCNVARHIQTASPMAQPLEVPRGRSGRASRDR